MRHGVRDMREAAEAPSSFYQGVLRGRLVHVLKATLGGEASVEVAVATPAGLLFADVAWASSEFMRSHGGQTPLTVAPEICIEVLGPSDSLEELRESAGAYLAAGAREVWIVHPRWKRCEFHGRQGPMARSRYPVHLGPLFT